MVEQFLLEIRGQALYAEQLGMHSVWIGEHHFNRRGCVPVPGLTLANIAASTSRIRLGPAVVVLNIHHPIQVAEEWGALDQLSGGRLTVNIVPGGSTEDQKRYGDHLDHDERYERASEFLDAARAFWQKPGERVNFRGKYFV